MLSAVIKNVISTCRTHTHTQHFTALYCFSKFYTFVSEVGVYDVRKVVIGSVTPQRPGLYPQMDLSTFSQIAKNTHSGEKKITNK